MKSKKYSLFLLACLSSMSLSMFAQLVPGGSYNIFDSSLIPSSRTAQHRSFLDHNYSYPAKPRNMWEVGVKVGVLTVSGDVPAYIPTGGFGIHVRKSLGYTVSLKLEYINGVGKGMHWLQHNNYQKNTPWVAAGYQPDRIVYASSVGGQNAVNLIPGRDIIFDNYKTNIQDLSLFGVITLNNIRFHKRQSGIVIYGEAGVGATSYNTKVNARGSDNNRYNFNSVAGGQHKTRKDVWKAIKNLPNWDKTYESAADNHGPRRPKLFGGTLKPSGTIGMGVAWRLNNRFNIALEDRWTFVKDDLLDGYRWQVHARGDAVMTRDFDSYNMLTLGLNVNLGSKSTQPLWWENPLDYVYSEMSNPKITKRPAEPCKDSDADGVCDFFDTEVTPTGCPVDSHGVSRDTDGDGVVDCKDKELNTSTPCQKEVDADGIGKCPESECCKEIKDMVEKLKIEGKKVAGCEAIQAATLAFNEGSCNLSSDVKAQLDELAAGLKGGADCKVKVVAGTTPDKGAQKTADCRLKAITSYLVNNKGISKDRIMTEKSEDADANSVTTEVAQ
jgi:hypothetical protein